LHAVCWSNGNVEAQLQTSLARLGKVKIYAVRYGLLHCMLQRTYFPVLAEHGDWSRQVSCDSLVWEGFWSKEAVINKQKN